MTASRSDFFGTPPSKSVGIHPLPTTHSKLGMVRGALPDHLQHRLLVLDILLAEQAAQAQHSGFQHVHV